jgi:hypothetical protein
MHSGGAAMGKTVVHVYYAALADRVHSKTDALGVLLRFGLPREWYYRLRSATSTTEAADAAAAASLSPLLTGSR